MHTPRAIVASLVRAWETDVALSPSSSRSTLAPVCMVHDVLFERGYDEALARSRAASRLDPFAFHLALGRLGADLLLGSTRRP